MSNSIDRWEIYRSARSENSREREQVFEKIWRCYYPRIFRYLKGFSFGDGAEDIAQEVMMKVLQNLGSYNPAFAFSPWLYRVAHNHCIDIKRKRGLPMLEAEIDLESIAALKPDPSAEISIKDNQRLVGFFVETLGPLDRQIMFLRFFEELSSRQIGKILQMPGGTVRYRISLIRQQFAKFWSDAHERR
jgi:RNA polymerase sigma factor (sigma-70 family)